MLEIARAMPSFGGFYYTDQGQVEVLLTNADHLSEAEARIRPRLSRSSPDAVFTARTATYAFLELARYRTVLRQRIFEISGVVTLGVRESANRVKVGIEEADAEALVRSLMSELEVPQQAVMFTTESRGIELAVHRVDRPLRRTGTLTLDHQQPNGLLQGGWRIERSSGGGCTLGFPALRYSDHLPVFVTNSHCTDVRTSPDSTIFRQPERLVGPQVGHEIADPPSYTCSTSPYDCRNSDAAMIQADATIDFGRIARTVDMSSIGCEHCVQSLVIDSSEPTLLISGRNDNVFENETLNKIGQTSGWTRGNVEDTCDDFPSGPEGEPSWVKQCSDRVDLNVDLGDSGSPVFSVLPDGTVELRGIVHSEQECCLGYHDAWMSDLNQIEKDLGNLIVHDPGPPGVTILGPTEVTPDVWCTWYTSRSDGVPPYTYQWWGMFSGSGPSIDGFVGSSGGELFVKVTDGFGREATDAIEIVVEGEPGPIQCQ